MSAALLPAVQAGKQQHGTVRQAEAQPFFVTRRSGMRLSLPFQLHFCHVSSYHVQHELSRLA
jgi:hypothetical protein